LRLVSELLWQEVPVGLKMFASILSFVTKGSR